MIRIIDEFETQEQAVLRFHIQNEVHKEGDNSFSFSNGTITFDEVHHVNIVLAEHSLFYMDKENHRVLEANFERKRITTEIEIRLDKI